jgi:NADH-quinone oxidoreductase subunit H
MVSYEVPMALCVVVPVIVAGSMRMVTIGQMQTGFFTEWLVFHDPFTFTAFWTYFTCATASCKRAPFDLAEAESELVAGFHTEYSGLRWSFFFMAEYGAMFAVSGIAVTLFLGAWHTGFLWFDPSVLLEEKMGLLGWILGNAINVIVFVLKGWILVFVMIWVRWTLPRLRIDQVMMTCLKYLLPISCGLLLGVSVWQLAAVSVPALNYLKYPAGIICMALFFYFIWKAAMTTQAPPDSGMATLWASGGPLKAHIAQKS